ncbi:hypothetical protein FRC08_002373 [Ceratobasidium sp. 394]|nr:hypothetical protein FRC08_002373 [Ceratobasidium sp. 394]
MLEIRPAFALTSLPPLPPLGKDELLLRHTAEVDAELLHWEQLEGYDYETMCTLDLVEFWKYRLDATSSP